MNYLQLILEVKTKWDLESIFYKETPKFTVHCKRKIDDNALVALALAVAQSLPEQRDLIIKLIINLIKTN
jgi:hypothetical protein